MGHWENAKYKDFGPFWPSLEKSRVRAENGKTQLAGARGPKIDNKNYHAIRDGCPQLFYILRFGRPDPHRQEIAKYGGFRPFWPRTALGT